MAIPYTLPTVQELAEIAEQELRGALDPQGSGAVDLADGARNTALVSMQVGMGARVVRYAADREAASRASTAENDDLDVVGRDFYSEPRKVAAKATGFRKLLRGASRPATTIPKGSRFAVPASGATPAVVFIASVTVPVLENETTVDVPLEAVVEGEAGNIADPTTVTQILDALPDTTWAVTTPTAGTVFGGGAETESDAVYRARLLQISTEDKAGTDTAILAGILRVPGVRYGTVMEPGNGTVVGFLGDAGYRLTPAMKAAVQRELRSCRCYGVPVDLRPLVVTDVPVVGIIYMSRPVENYDVDAIRAAAVANVVAYFDQRPQLDEYFADTIRAAISRAHPEVQRATISAPFADVVRNDPEAYAGFSSLTTYRTTAEQVRVSVVGPYLI